MAARLGCRVRYADGLGGPCGIMVGGIIIVEGRLTAGTRALTIAHEIAHLVNDEAGLLRSHGLELEIGIDLAAAAILMPRHDVARVLLLYGSDLGAMLARFGDLPPEVVAIRMVSMAYFFS
jgi:Zn-dependent peptidase ImmA (M78 family)